MNLTSFPDSAFTRNLKNLGIYRQQRYFDYAKPNETFKVVKKVSRIFLLMKNKLKTGQGQRPITQNKKGLVFFVNGIV